MALLPVAWMAGILAAAAAGVCYLRKRIGRSLVWRLLPVFVLWGMVWYERDMRQVSVYEAAAEAYAGRNVEAEGDVAGIQDRKSGDGLTLRLADTVILGESGRRRYGDILVYIDEGEEFHVGERVRVQGRLERFDRPGNPGEFDRNGYYHSMGIEGCFFGERTEHLNEGCSPYLDGLYRLRRMGCGMVDRICTEEDRGVFKAMILGEKTELSEDIKNLYRDSGIAHVLAISGLHISLIGMGCYTLLRRAGMGIKGAGAVGGAAVVSYGILVSGGGIAASVSRAVCMVFMKMMADWKGRTYDMRTAAAVAAMLLLLQSPQLLFQAGFQLSFGAVAVLGTAMPAAEAWMGTERGWQKTLLAGAVIQLAGCPVTAYHYFEYPVYGILLNLAVIPLMPLVLISGILGIMLGGVDVRAGTAAVGAGHYVLGFYRWICGKVQGLCGAVRVTGRPAVWQIGAYAAMWCVCLSLAALWAKKSGAAGISKVTGEGKGAGRGEAGTKGVWSRRAFGMFFAAVSLAVLLLRFPVKGMEVTFLDVGQGDGICIRTGDSVILVDGGSTDRKELGAQVLEPFLKSRGISRVDWAIVSHGDQDHISGLMGLMEEDCGIEIRSVVLPQHGQKGGDEAYRKLEQAARGHGAKVEWMKRGDMVLEGELEIRCLYAGEEGTESADRNEHSLMLHVRFGQAGILLTGDMSAQGEKRWLKSGETPRIQVLKAAHHGSSYSTGEEFLDRLCPRWAVISCGEGNRYGHPGEDTLKRLDDRGIKWYVTMDTGAVTVRTDGREMSVETFITCR